MDIVYLDFSKPFDTVPHIDLIQKLYGLGLNTWVVQWIFSWLKDRYQSEVVNGVHLEHRPVTSGVP